jgi:hypothetical protein
MRIQQYIAIIFSVMVFTGCTKEFHPRLDAVKPLYVIEGKISNMRGPYFVRITKSAGLEANIYPGNIERDSVEGVKNALVIITDDTGIKDTLIPGTQTLDRYVYYFRDSAAYNVSSIDSIFTREDDRFTVYERGYYQTTRLQGKPGHTYYLEVQIGDNLFRSSAYMPPVPVLEHAEWRADSVLDPILNVPRFLPVVWFKDPPDEKNYYGVNFTGSIAAYRYDYFLVGFYAHVAYNAYPYYIFDDKSLTSDVNSVSVRYIPLDPQSLQWNSPQYFRSPAPTPVRLNAFTKETYDYFNTIYKQIEYNGNIYKPSPASARGNISGGALGLFYATSVSDKLADH